MKNSRLLGALSATALLFYISCINAALLGGTVTGCLGFGDSCTTDNVTGNNFDGSPKTIEDPGIEFSYIQNFSNGNIIGHHADFTDTTLTLIIDGTETFDPYPGLPVGRASNNWLFYDISLVEPNRIITGVFLTGESGLNVDSISFDSDRIYIHTKGFYYYQLAGKVLSATFTVVTSEVDIEPNISISGGERQECVTEGGNLVTFTYVGSADVASIEWFLDGVSVGFEQAINTFVTLGEHAIEASIVTAQGSNQIESATVVIVDTTAPSINTTFIDTDSGSLITTVERKASVEATIDVSDVCDPAPTSNSIFGVPTQNHDVVGIEGKKKDDIISSITLTSPSNTDSVELSVIAEDASGNVSTYNAVLPVVP